jgi:small GTP-binding protein
MTNGSTDFKVVMLGFSGVGKTSLVEQLYTGEFSSKVTSTIAAGYVRASIQLPGRVVTLSIWDTAGQERFHGLAPLYVRDSHAAIFVFDMAAKDPLTELTTFYASIKESIPPVARLFLCANKMDLVSDSVDLLESTAWGAERNMELMRTSAKTGVGVQELFTSVALVISETFDMLKANPGGQTKMMDMDSTNRQRCC